MAQLPLEGCRVIDFGWVWAGPMLGGLLADLGAEVIRVESRDRPDNLREIGRPISENFVQGCPHPDLKGEDIEQVPMFHNVNRGKLGITLNLKHPEAPGVIKELARVSDVVIENFTPQVLRRVGLGYDDLREVRPDLIMISMAVAGQSGPLSDIRTYAPSLTSLGGLESLVGYPEEPVLGMLTFGYGDPNAAACGAFALLAALYHRHKTGEGQHIDLSQLEAAVCLLGEALLDHTMNGRVAGPQGNRNPFMAPHGIYPCKGEDQWVAVAVETNEDWRTLCRAMEKPDLVGEERFADVYNRLQHWQELDQILAQWTRRHTPYEVMEILQRSGVAAAPVLDIDGLGNDPHFQKRGIRVPCEHPVTGPETLCSNPWNLSDTSPKVRQPAPMLGQHNHYVFGQLLGKSPEEVNRLEKEGVAR